MLALQCDVCVAEVARSTCAGVTKAGGCKGHATVPEAVGGSCLGPAGGDLLAKLQAEAPPSWVLQLLGSRSAASLDCIAVLATRARQPAG